MQSKITKEDEVKLNKLLQDLDDARNKSIHYLRRGQIQKASLHFMLESVTSDEINVLLKEILRRENESNKNTEEDIRDT